MIVDDLYLVGIAVLPDEAKSPLIVDPDAVLALAVTPERLESVAGRYGQIAEFGGTVQEKELAPSNTLEGSKSGDILVFEQRLCLLAPERLDHLLSVQRQTLHVKGPTDPGS